MPGPETNKKAVARKAEGKPDLKAQALNRSQKKKEILKRGIKYSRFQKAQTNALKALRKDAARTPGRYFVEPEAKVALVVRIRGINDMPPKPRKILDLLRLKTIFNAVFVKLNRATLEMLRRVDPWITWGYPTQATIRKLVLKRGFGKVKGQRIKFEDNSVVERGLGKYGLICVDDVIHQIATVGDKFKEVNNFLWPFKLSAPTGGLKQKRRHFVENGDFGNREEFINNLVKQML
jgi:large subunit ribosomal protein L7e